MNFSIDDQRREVIPRWRNYKTTAWLGELGDGKQKKLIIDKKESVELVKKKFEWEEHLTLPFAADLIGAAFVEKQYDFALGAARFVLYSSKGASDTLIRISKKILIGSDDNKTREFENLQLKLEEKDEQHKKIHFLKKMVNVDPLDAISCSELSRGYAVLGEVEKSKKFMKRALSLAPNNRYLLRSAASLYLHLNDPQQAQYLLFHSESVKYDPWILSAEIAISSAQDKVSKFTKTARDLMKSNNFSNHHLTELSSMLGTLEYEAGSVKQARYLMKLSLEDPNENTVAQACWVSRHYSFNAVEQLDKFFDVPLTFEAKASMYRAEGEWEKSLNEIDKWIIDQPFSRDPVTLSSYIAATGLRDFERSIQISKFGLIANPNDPIILNNLAFSLANSGKVDEAEEWFQRIRLNDLDDDMKTMWSATRGLLYYRKGLRDEGIRFYTEAIEFADKRKDKLQKAMATVYFAQEELKYKSERVHGLLKIVNDLSTTVSDAEFKVELSRLNQTAAECL